LKSSQNVYTTITLKRFPPVTAGKNLLQRKKDLRGAIKKEVGEKKLKKMQERCKGKHLFLTVTYRLAKTSESGNSQKDLDNLIKILFDVLPDYIASHSKDEEFKGLGLIENDRDIFKICCEKEIIEPGPAEGLDLMISIMKQ
jgi:Holliday junction resolvase RusA-like endonuclease